jgi:D-serine deaminase-like pyridoxal phosphate-dependent protein
MNDLELHGHLIGRQGSRHDLNTPVLILDQDALDRNIARMAEFAASKGLKLRPHAKTHKSPDVARRQVAAGAVGACCAKLGEAEALADGGVLSGLHLTSPVVSAPAIARLVALNARTEALMCVVDHPENVRALGEAARGGKPLTVIIDIDPGIRRTGVASPEAAVALLAAIQQEPALREQLNLVMTAMEVSEIARAAGQTFRAETLISVFQLCNEQPYAREGLMDEKLIRVFLRRESLL